MKPTLGVYGPKPPEKSGVAGYIAASLPYLSEAFDVTHVGNADGDVDPNGFNHVLYHLSNNSLSEGAFVALRRRPGPIFLHEYINLSYYYNCWERVPRSERRMLLDIYAKGLEVERFPQRSRRRNIKLFLKFLLRGLDGSIYARSELDRLFGMRSNLNPSSMDFGTENLVISRATSVLIHSQAVINRLSVRYPNVGFHKVQFPVDHLVAGDLEGSRTRLGLPSGFLFATMGFGGPFKRLEWVIEAWEGWADRPEDAILCVVGEPAPDIDLTGRAGIVSLGYVSDNDFESLLLAVDCGIQLRYPSVGETSAVASRFVANGMSVILSDIPEMRDYDGLDGVRYVPTGAGRQDGLVESMCAAYSQGRRTPTRREGYEWTDWQADVLTALGVKD